MSHTFTDEAIVLRTYNVGETDRFCILLTKEHGKLAARAQGVRRLTSQRGSGLLPLHRSSVTLAKHSFGHVVTAATCLDAHCAAWKSPHAFGTAAHGIEIVLKLTDEGVELPDVYALTLSFLASCRSSQSHVLVPVFICQLLSTLGLFPSVTHSSRGDKFLVCDSLVFHADGAGFGSRGDTEQGFLVSSETLSLLQIIDDLCLSSLPLVSEETSRELTHITQGLLGNQLGAVLSSPVVSLALSSAEIPICQ